MQSKKRISLAMFLVAALLSAWLSPAFSSGSSRTVSDLSETILPGWMDGQTLLPSDEALDLIAGVSQGVRDSVWRLDGRVVGKTPELHLEHVPVGDHTVDLSYRDAQDQLFAVSTVVRILDPGPYAIQIAAIELAIYLPLWDEDSEVYLPTVQR